MRNLPPDNLPQKVFWSPLPYAMGIELLEAEPGRALLRLPFSEQLRQSFGQLHGGAIFTLADTASGRAAHSVQPEGKRCVTLEMKINFISGVQDEDCLAEARVIHHGETSLVFTGIRAHFSSVGRRDFFIRAFRLGEFPPRFNGGKHKTRDHDMFEFQAHERLGCVLQEQLFIYYKNYKITILHLFLDF